MKQLKHLDTKWGFDGLLDSFDNNILITSYQIY